MSRIGIFMGKGIKTGPNIKITLFFLDQQKDLAEQNLYSRDS